MRGQGLVLIGRAVEDADAQAFRRDVHGQVAGGAAAQLPGQGVPFAAEEVVRVGHRDLELDQGHTSSLPKSAFSTSFRAMGAGVVGGGV
ncbi:hypothetical protein IHN32_11575 [Deinococcus sp. 14RED07]|uniref:hypothetical protein n=1 Tax=Deinococcus sp. 14RED07 TaxID=2745874 RepID=UPI001E50B947|nr:hypothetical protein [Deinococcus sp. 14RED07]MCD0176580.1 hypothetical protein [Deinococcus sp. 14RED07]